MRMINKLDKFNNICIEKRSLLLEIQVYDNLKQKSSKKKMNESLNRSQKVFDEQSKLKIKAKVLKQQLEISRKKKQAEADKKLKQTIINHYQAQFEIYKAELQEYTQTQKASLELVKQFKINEVNQFKKCVIQSLQKLQKSLLQAEQHQKQLQQRKSQAIQFLNLQRSKQIDEQIQKIEQEKNKKIQEYSKSIEID